MFGASFQRFLKDLVEGPRNRVDYRLHFVTMREMVNVILAACDGREGNPGETRHCASFTSGPPDFTFQP
jgi:hypothetical protein